jgi:hypothetical protein
MLPLPLQISKNSKVIEVAELSDIHLGHPNTPTTLTVSCLLRMFPDNAITANLDIIYLAGDVFDRQLNMSDENVFHIHGWICVFLALCKKHDIIVRVLEGTPSHDWKQSKWFTEINDKYGIGADVKHVTSLSIEYIERLDIQVLYIPDEWSGSCAETQRQVTLLLKQYSLTQVDFTIMHGAFPHQLPPHLHNRLDLHNSDFYLSITRYFVFVGHIHLQSQYDRILSSGSTNRIAHGEEGDKGHYRVTVRDNGIHDINFIVNPHAMPYITIDAEGLTVDETKALIKPQLAKIKDGYSAIRVHCNVVDAAVAVVDNYKATHSHIAWKVEVKKRHNKQRVLVESVRKDIDKIVLHQGNLADMLLSRITVKRPELATRCRKLLIESEVLDG